MINNIYITTTGLTPSVIFSDLGYRTFTHPVINDYIGDEFSYNELIDSYDFNDSLDAGYLTASFNGVIITSSTDLYPVIGAQLDSSIVYTNQSNTFGTFSQTFKSGNFGIYNPNNTFIYSFTASNITASRNILLPLLTTDDTFVFQSFSQSMTNKTLLSTSNNVIDATRLQTFTVSTTTPVLNQALLWNGSSWSPGNVSTSGVTTLNGLTSSTQSFTSSNDTNVLLNIVSSGSTHSFNVSWTGALPVTRGGSGTSSTFATGSVIFAGPNGTYYQDNPNFYWDDTNNRLGIGTTSPVQSISTTGNIRSNGFLEILNQTNPATPTGASRIYFDTNNRFSWIGTNGFTRTFDGISNTGNRTYVLPDDNTTLVGTGSSQVLTNKTLLSTNNNVIDATRLQTFTVSTATPSLNNILSWSGTSWTPIDNNITGSTGPTGPGGGITSFSSTFSTTTTTALAFPNQMTGVAITGLTAGNYLVFFGGYLAVSTNATTVSTRIYIDATGIVASEMVWQRPNQAVNSTHVYAGYPVTLAVTGTVSIHWVVSSGTGTMTNPYMTIIRR